MADEIDDIIEAVLGKGNTLRCDQCNRVVAPARAWSVWEPSSTGDDVFCVGDYCSEPCASRTWEHSSNPNCWITPPEEEP
jgi:hypothetical protein